MKTFNIKTFVISASALLVVVAASSVSYGQRACGCQPSMGDQFRAGYDANVQWPSRYTPSARNSICGAYSAMVNNGWRRQNLLGDYHFNRDTNELTHAGKLKVNWILSQAPVQRRSVFVQRAGKELETTTRLASVHDYAGKMSSVAQLDVQDTHIVAEGHPASSVDNVFVGYEKNRLPPVLPASTGGGGDSGQ